MYLRHFALTRLPFETPAHTDELFRCDSHREAEARLKHLIDLRGIGLLTGSPAAARPACAATSPGRCTRGATGSATWRCPPAT